MDRDRTREAMTDANHQQIIGDATMKYSATLPTIEGYYWLRRPKKEDDIVYIRDLDDGLVPYGAMVSWPGSDWDKSLCDVIAEAHCEWAGPLKPPTTSPTPPDISA